MNPRIAIAAIALFFSTGLAGGQTGVTTTGGTTNTVPVFTGSSTVANSPISISGSNVGLGTTTPVAPLHVMAGADETTGFSGSTSCSVESSTCPASANSGYGIVLDADYSNGAYRWRFETIDRNDGISLYVQQTTWPPGSAFSNVARFGSNVHDNNQFAVFGNSYLGGNVGIGTASPGASLEVNGNVKLTSNSGASITFQDGTTQTTAYTGVSCGGDFAESVDVTGSRQRYEPGDLLVIDPKEPGEFLEAAQPYSTLVAGVFSTKPGYVGRRLTGPKSPNEVPLAMVGIVPVKVTTENGPIKTGDLLVASSTPGRAMRGTDRSRLTGAVVGKSLGNLSSGKGIVEVLVALQ